MSAPAPDRRKLFLLVVAAVAAFAAFALGREWLDRVWFFPWATARAGRPALAGAWVGQLATGSGSPRGVYVELWRYAPRRKRRSYCRKCATIEGRALTCDERGGERRYRLLGATEDRRGTRLQLSAAPAFEPPADGLELSNVVGGWDGADALTLAAEFSWRRGGAAISSSDDPDTSVDPTLRMRRGTEPEYRAACRGLASP